MKFENPVPVHAEEETLHDAIPVPDVRELIHKYDKYARQSSYNISDQQALLSPNTVRGYSLEDKCWMEFDIEQVQDIEWEQNCLSNLQIDDLVRDNLKCLVKQHSVLNGRFKDIVAGKDQGLIVLLRGLPGSGKTLTAEAISEESKEPLLRVASGHLGTEPGLAERKLKECFKLAQAWNAILLLDEADVFLASRTSGDNVRNAFITIFLRSMEYYACILVLTTKQHEPFDETFQSRIHLQIPYAPHNANQRKAIWFNTVADQNTPHSLDDAAFQSLAEKWELNGREIKNIVLLAMLIAQAKEIRLDRATIEAVCAMDAR